MDEHKNYPPNDPILSAKAALAKALAEAEAALSRAEQIMEASQKVRTGSSVRITPAAGQTPAQTPAIPPVTPAAVQTPAQTPAIPPVTPAAVQKPAQTTAIPPVTPAAVQTPAQTPAIPPVAPAAVQTPAQTPAIPPVAPAAVQTLAQTTAIPPVTPAAVQTPAQTPAVPPVTPAAVQTPAQTTAIPPVTPAAVQTPAQTTMIPPVTPAAVQTPAQTTAIPPVTPAAVETPAQTPAVTEAPKAETTAQTVTRTAQTETTAQTAGPHPWEADPPHTAMSAETEAEQDEEYTAKDFLNDTLDLVGSVLISVFVVMLVFTYLFRVADVEGDSMLPTLRDRDKLLLTRIGRDYETGDVLILNSTKSYTFDKSGDLIQGDGLGKQIVKRLIAQGGQEVNIDFTAGIVYVDGEALEEPYVSTLTTRDEGGFSYPFTVPEGYVFVLGDNRYISKDSRHGDVGLIPVKDITGRVIWRILPFSDFGSVN